MCVNMAVSDPFFARQAVEKWIPLRFCPLFHSLYDAADANPPLLLTLPLIGRLLSLTSQINFCNDHKSALFGLVTHEISFAYYCVLTL